MQGFIRFVGVAVVLVGLCWVVGASTGGITDFGVTVWHGGIVSVAWLWQHWVVAAVIVGVLILVWMVTGLSVLLPGKLVKDPKRLYDTHQRQLCFSRADHRCEMDTIIFTRCRRPAEQADHWIPHSKGGATNVENVVAACALHNRMKSNLVPTFWQTARISSRRRRYFPHDIPTKPGSRFRR